MMGRKKKYIEMFGSFTEPFNCKFPLEYLMPPLRGSPSNFVTAVGLKKLE